MILTDNKHKIETKNSQPQEEQPYLIRESDSEYDVMSAAYDGFWFGGGTPTGVERGEISSHAHTHPLIDV